MLIAYVQAASVFVKKTGLVAPYRVGLAQDRASTVRCCPCRRRAAAARSPSLAKATSSVYANAGDALYTYFYVMYMF